MKYEIDIIQNSIFILYIRWLLFLSSYDESKTAIFYVLKIDAVLLLDGDF